MKQIRKELNHYITFNILGMIGMSCYILADTFFIAQALKTPGLAALNFSIAFFSLMQGVGLMIGIGGATDFSLQTKENRNDSFMHALILGGLAACFFLFIGIYFAQPLAQFLGADAETFTLTTTYLRTFLSFSPFFILNNILLGFVRNDANPQLAMVAMLVSSFSNIVLDYIFIFPFQWGIFGAALATGLSPVISCLICSLHFIQRKNTFHFEKTKYQLKHFMRICNLGVSSLIGECASAIALFTFNWIILGISGNTGVAAYGIIANIALIATAIFTGIAQGLQPIASRLASNNQTQHTTAVMRYIIGLSFGVAGLIYGGIVLNAHEIISLFNSEQDVLLSSLAHEGTLIYFLGYFFAGINIVVIAFLSATGNTKRAILTACSRSCCVLVPVVWILARLLGMKGIWLSFPVTECLVLILPFMFSKFIRN